MTVVLSDSQADSLMQVLVAAQGYMSAEDLKLQYSALGGSVKSSKLSNALRNHVNILNGLLNAIEEEEEEEEDE